MNKLILPIAFASLLLLGSATAQTISGCSSVAANRVSTSKDVVKLQADADCFARAGETASAARKVRLDRIAALTPKPVPTPTPPPVVPGKPVPPEGYAFCANEGQACELLGRNEIKYGAGGKFNTAAKAGNFFCDNNSFGDPIAGTVKACFYKAAPVDEVTPPTAPTLAGLAKVSSGIKISDWLVPSWGTGAVAPSGKPDVVGAFRFICNAGQLAYDDPIVFPGQPGKSHLHQFFGNTAADGNSTYASLRTSGESTCNNWLNRSAYWIPAMMNGKGKVVRPDYVSIYYKRRPQNDPECLRQAPGGCVNLPRGLRYVFGYNMATNDGGGFHFNCDGPNAVSGSFPDIVTAAKGCPIGSKLGAVITAPDCWNGRDLDSPDHRSHMAYPGRDDWGREKCPATHPYVIPTFTMSAWYTTDADLDRSGEWTPSTVTWALSSDTMAGMPVKRPGTTMHADWFGAWEDDVLDMWQANCVNLLLNCSGGDLGNGKQLKMFDGFRWDANPRVVDAPARPIS